ncbi:hypothetical protein EMIT0194MI4_40498 [Pseudomonas sp. IT-194MI4]
MGVDLGGVSGDGQHYELSLILWTQLTGSQWSKVCKKPLISITLCKTLISMDVEVTNDLSS